MGESTQEKKAKNIYDKQGAAISDFQGTDLSLGENYRSFSSGDMLGNIDKTFSTGLKTGIDNISREADQDISRVESNTGERLMSQGIGSGSLFNNTVAGSGDSARRSKYGAIEGLTSKFTQHKGNAELDVMDTTNRMDQGDEQFNAMAKLRKYSALMDGINSQLSSVGMMDNTNGWDDALAGLNTAGNVAKGIASVATL